MGGWGWGGDGGAADRRASNGRVSPQEQNSIPNPQLSFPWMSTMLPDRACFILGERAECNATRCVSKWDTTRLCVGIMRGHTQGVAGFPANRMRCFPHAIETPTANLVFESEHIPISVSLGDTFDRELERISAKDPKELIRQFWETLIRRGEILREKVRQSYVPED